MLLLTSTSDIVRIVTAAAVATIGVHASWVENNAGAMTPGRTNTNISTAATTTVVAAPSGASIQKTVNQLTISNNHASSSQSLIVQHYDGTTSVDLYSITLLAGEVCVLNQNGIWEHYDSQGGRYFYNGPITTNLGIDGTLSETIDREVCAEINTTMAASGTLNMQAIYLWAGQLVTSITLSSATTAAGTPTNYFFALYNGSRVLLANTANQTTTAWAANTVKTVALTTPYRISISGLYYIGYYMTASTVPTLKGTTAKTGGQLAGTAPILQGQSSTGLTTALPDPAAAITVDVDSFWAAVT